jgi:hypothetical protein
MNENILAVLKKMKIFAGILMVLTLIKILQLFKVIPSMPSFTINLSEEIVVIGLISIIVIGFFFGIIYLFYLHLKNKMKKRYCDDTKLPAKITFFSVLRNTQFYRYGVFCGYFSVFYGVTAGAITGLIYSILTIFTYLTAGLIGGFAEYFYKMSMNFTAFLAISILIAGIIILILNIKDFSENQEKFVQKITEKGNEYNKLNFIAFILFILDYL